MGTIDIVFDGPPGPEAGRFVEVERDGESIRLGEWVERPDGYWVLRIDDPADVARLEFDKQVLVSERNRHRDNARESKRSEIELAKHVVRLEGEAATAKEALTQLSDGDVGDVADFVSRALAKLGGG